PARLGLRGVDGIRQYPRRSPGHGRSEAFALTGSACFSSVSAVRITPGRTLLSFRDPGGSTVPRRPVIGIATQTLEAVPGKLPLCWVMGQCYVRALTNAGAVPWLVPLLPDDEATLRAVYEHLDGVFLTGGVDVDPASYGEPRHELCDRTDPARDWTEL